MIGATVSGAGWQRCRTHNASHRRAGGGDRLLQRIP
ncbi:hypothetical protein [Nocardia asteroides]